MDYQKEEKEKKGEIKEETKKVLLCACKKYTNKQTNGVLFINTEIEENKDLITEYYKTDSFEVNCFCQININENNNLIKTNYFFIGGFDTEKREGVIKLCKLIYIDNKFNMEIIEENVYIDHTGEFEGFKGTINCIIQSKINRKILVNCWDGHVYCFSEPNIKIYLEEDKELDNEFN